MKYRTKNYAVLLADLMTMKTSVRQQKKSADSFLALLVKNGDLHTIDEIVRMTRSLFLKKTGGRSIVVETARPIKEKPWTSLFKKGDVMKEKISPELIAGLRISIDDKQLDISLAGKLQVIFQKT